MINKWLWEINSENGVAVTKSDDTIKLIGLPEPDRPKISGFTADMIHPVASVWDTVIPKSENDWEITDWVPDKCVEIAMEIKYDKKI